jgi:hypothetical protein
VIHNLINMKHLGVSGLLKKSQENEPQKVLKKNEYS